MKRIICIISLITCVLCASAKVFVESKIDSIQILIGEQTGLTLSVTTGQGAHVTMPSFKPSEYITPGVEVLECSNADTSKLDNGLVRITRKYTLTSFDENLYYIPPMKVKVDGKEYQSKSLALKVLTVPVDTLHPEKFYPPKGVQDNPFLWSEWEQAVECNICSCLCVDILFVDTLEGEQACHSASAHNKENTSAPESVEGNRAYKGRQDVRVGRPEGVLHPLDRCAEKIYQGKVRL